MDDPFEVYRQRVIIDIVWMRPPGENPRVDWENELAQALNEAAEYRGTLWHLRVEDTERLKGIENIE